MNLSIERKTGAGLALVGLFLLLVSMMAYRNSRDSLENSKWVAHTREVIAELNATQSAADDWQTSVREYLLTGESSYLKPYRDSFSLVINHVDRLKALTADNASQQVRALALRSQLMALFNVLDQTVNSRREKGFETARQELLAGGGRLETNAMRTTIADMRAEEEQLLGMREKKVQTSSRLSAIAFFTVIVFEILMLVLIYYTIRKDITQRRRTEELLHESEERHRKLFNNNPHPTWVYDRETLQFLAVNNAAVRKYGYSMDEFLVMTIKDIRPAEDIPALLESVSHVTEGSEKVSDWRHRRKDGSIIDVEITSYPLNFSCRPAEVIVAVDISQKNMTKLKKPNS